MIKPGDPATARPLVDAVPATARARRRVALLVDPRFPGGTGSAVAAEIRALAPRVNLAVFDLATAMFRGRAGRTRRSPALWRSWACRSCREPPVVHADTIVLHNPTCLRFDSALGPRLSAARVIVVTHENFLRPGGCEGFDVGHCLGLVAGRVAGGERLLAPDFGHQPRERRRLAGAASGFGLAPRPGRLAEHLRPAVPRADAHAARPPRPPLACRSSRSSRRSRRCAPSSRHRPSAARSSAPTPCFSTARACRRTGSCCASGRCRFPISSPASTSSSTSPIRCWRESFGRAIAEAIAAGKLVITDPETAEPFGPGVVADTGTGDGIDRIIASHVADPSRYAAAVRRAQADLAAYRPDPVAARLAALLEPEAPAACCSVRRRAAAAATPRISRSSRASSPRSAFRPGSRPDRSRRTRAATCSSTSPRASPTARLRPDDGLALLAADRLTDEALVRLRRLADGVEITVRAFGRFARTRPRSGYGRGSPTSSAASPSSSTSPRSDPRLPRAPPRPSGCPDAPHDRGRR